MEIEHEAKEQMRDCSGISEILDRWSNFTVAMAAWRQHWLVVQQGESQVSDALCQ
jgi:hypothetical protein